MNNVIDFQEFKNRKYIERRKGIQELTGMAGEPIFIDSDIQFQEPLDLEKLMEPDNCQEHIFTENEIGY